MCKDNGNCPGCPAEVNEMMETQRQGHGYALDRCAPPPQTGQSRRNFPLKQKLDVDLNVKPENQQLIGKVYCLYRMITFIFWIYVNLSIQFYFAQSVLRDKLSCLV